ncbi:MAG: hypothetical protein HN597_14880 [Desulfobacula sp.]|jgi:plasmid maintenance system antidote protein VapI|uniref:Uncharacterized protein n=1 Tax=uncultured marine virus TaxID=186617 RepID=A0A0F7L3P6_9VIRU|nr:hypothetical protein [uncultured marine virus]MBT7630967.1 hypothetical protein [Desulfobacula sp.]
MIKNKDIAITLKISDTLVCRLLNGERKVSWPLAERLSKMFPGKSMSEWKRATSKELKAAFNQLEKETV